MNLQKKSGMVALGVWLIFHGVLTLGIVSIPWDNIVLSVLAVVAGVLILLDR